MLLAERADLSVFKSKQTPTFALAHVGRVGLLFVEFYRRFFQVENVQLTAKFCFFLPPQFEIYV